MAKTANINIRIEPEIKEKSEKLFSTFGITVTDAIQIFLHQSLLVGGFPFKIKQPHYREETEAAIREAVEHIASKILTKEYSSVPELCEEIKKETDLE